MPLIRPFSLILLTFFLTSCLAKAPGVVQPTETEKQNNPFLFVNKQNSRSPAPVETKAFSETKRFYTVTADNPTVTIRLPSNAGTGYQWFIQEYPTAWVKIQNHKTINNNDNGAVGGSIEDVWELRIAPECFVSPQAITLKFVHQRPWENNDAVVPLTITILTMPRSS